MGKKQGDKTECMLTLYTVATFTHNMKTEQLTLYTKKEKRKKTGLQKGYHKGLLGTCKNT